MFFSKPEIGLSLLPIVIAGTLAGTELILPGKRCEPPPHAAAFGKR